MADFFEGGLTSLLVIGCETGLELASMYQRFPGIAVTGIDLSETMLNQLRGKYSDKEILILQADYFEYPFEENKYDDALSFETLHHYKLDKKRTIYDKLFQTVKKGGYYIECDYIACCDEEEELCLKEYEYRKKIKYRKIH